MNETGKPYNEIDDYIAAFSEEERQEYVAAATALDLAGLLYQLRQRKGLTQRGAAERTGLKQQAISRLEKAYQNAVSLTTNYAMAAELRQKLVVAQADLGEQRQKVRVTLENEYRAADRRYLGLLPYFPPRITRSAPCPGPWGSITEPSG